MNCDERRLRLPLRRRVGHVTFASPRLKKACSTTRIRPDRRERVQRTKANEGDMMRNSHVYFWLKFAEGGSRGGQPATGVPLLETYLSWWLASNARRSGALVPGPSPFSRWPERRVGPDRERERVRGASPLRARGCGRSRGRMPGIRRAVRSSGRLGRRPAGSRDRGPPRTCRAWSSSHHRSAGRYSSPRMPASISARRCRSSARTQVNHG